MQATSSHGLPACRCQINRPLAFRGHRACEYVASDATTACFNPAQASHADAGWTVSPFANSTCCAHHPEHTTGNGCLLRESHRHEPCAWDGGQRIAWLHIPKTGTSMLLWLARLANASLPSSARLVPHKPSRKTLLWEIFFRRWRPTEWFHGSSIFWRAGIEHAVISEDEYGSYRGRFFALFRDPRERGWSSYYHFANGSIGEEGSRSRVTPEQYAADCLRGTAVGMLAGQMRMGPFGSLDCHAVTNFSGLAPACGFVPNMELAKQRLDEGFAFVGLTEEWALSACLFATMFAVRCDAEMMSNARPGWLPPARQNRPEGSDPFADPHDLQLHQWVKERFHADLRKWRVTGERCAHELCPAAAKHFTGNGTSMK